MVFTRAINTQVSYFEVSSLIRTANENGMVVSSIDLPICRNQAFDSLEVRYNSLDMAEMFDVKNNVRSADQSVYCQELETYIHLLCVILISHQILYSLFESDITSNKLNY